MAAARALPTLGVLTLLALWLGVGLKAPVLFVLAAPSLLAGGYAGVESVDRRTVDAARTVEMTELQIVLSIELPLPRRSWLIEQDRGGGVSDVVLREVVVRGALFTRLQAAAGDALALALALAVIFLACCRCPSPSPAALRPRLPSPRPGPVCLRLRTSSAAAATGDTVINTVAQDRTVWLPVDPAVVVATEMGYRSAVPQHLVAEPFYWVSRSG